MGVVAVVVGGGPIRAPTPPGTRDGHVLGIPVVAGKLFDVVIAADSGLDHALGAGLRPDVLIGDLDSISARGLSWAEEHRLVIVAHPPDKDDTDTALALRHAVSTGHRDLVVLGASTVDRLDHLIGTIAALGAPDLAGFDSITAFVGDTELRVLHPDRTTLLDLPPGTTFSALALGAGCTGVRIDGARWPLADATIASGATVGISNLTIGGPVRITTRTGVLTVIVPPATT